MNPVPSPSDSAAGNAREPAEAATHPVTGRVPMSDGRRIAVHCWGPDDGQWVLLIHATGFHGRCWNEVVRALPGQLRVLAVDLRGHGESDPAHSYGWDAFGADMIAIADHYDLHNAVVVGHSMGGHCAAQLAAARPQRCGRLLLIDPVIFEPAAYPANRHRMFERVEDHPVARRRRHWDSWEAMRDQLREKGYYGLWAPAVLDDYCRYGSKPHAKGVELSCLPEVEAAVYLGSSETDIHTMVSSITAPTTVLRAPPRRPEDDGVLDFSKSPTWPDLARLIPQGTDVLLEHLTHFIPMQAPELVAAYVDAAVRDLRIDGDS